MAELVHDLVPDARLVLVGYRTQEQFAEAAAWVAQQGIPVASHSNSFLSRRSTAPAAPPGRSTRRPRRACWGRLGRQLRPAALARDGRRQRHRPRHRPDRWDAAARVAGVDVAAGRGQRVRRARRRRRRLAGGGAQHPGRPPQRDHPGHDRRRRGLPRRRHPGVRPAEDLDLFSETVGFGAAAVAEGSIPTPGDARGALTVGAVKWTGTSIEPYSSQGIPGGGKPDLVGPTYVTSNPEWPGTAGTSAAAAYVAGAAVLLRQRRLALGLPAGPAELRGVLVSGALDLGAEGPDPVYGAGMARLDTSAPRLVLRVGPGPRRVVRVRATDAGTVRQVQVTLNGRRLGTWRRPVAGVRLPAGARGRLQAIAEDMAGNVAVRARTVARGR